MGCSPVEVRLITVQCLLREYEGTVLGQSTELQEAEVCATLQPQQEGMDGTWPLFACIIPRIALRKGCRLSVLARGVHNHKDRTTMN